MAASGRLWPALIASGVGKSLPAEQAILQLLMPCQVSLEDTTSSANRYRRSLVNYQTRSPSEPVSVRQSRTANTLLGKCFLSTRSTLPSCDAILELRSWDRPSSQPHGGIKHGGASPVDPSKPSVAGTTPESRKGYSADHNVKTRSDPTVHDGTRGGGVGVAEMRERKMEGKGLPSPQVCMSPTGQ